MRIQPRHGGGDQPRKPNSARDAFACFPLTGGRRRFRRYMRAAGNTRFPLRLNEIVQNVPRPEPEIKGHVRTWCAVRLWVVRRPATTRRRAARSTSSLQGRTRPSRRTSPVAGTWPVTTAFRSSGRTSPLAGSRANPEAIRRRRGDRRNRTGNFAMLRRSGAPVIATGRCFEAVSDVAPSGADRTQ